MARGLALTVVVVVVVFLGATSAFQKFHGFQGTPTVFFPPTFVNTPPLVPSFFYSAGPVQAVRVAVDHKLPCPDVGFYLHPTNCSRFYRCVDHSGTGRFYVRYIFECPTGHVFAEEAATCLPGACDAIKPSVRPPVQPPVIPSTDPPVQPTNPPVQPTNPPVQPTDPSVQPTNPSVQPTDPSVQPTDPPVQPTNPPVQPTDPPVQPTPPPSQSCMGQYVQDNQYCNIYRRCNETKPRYACPAGTVFDEPRQMCRISAADEALCKGKVFSKFPHSLRTELVDGHIRIPDDYVLTPLVPFMPLNIPAIAPPHHTLRTQPIPAHPPPPPPPQTSSSPFFVGLPPSDRPAPYRTFPADTLPLSSYPAPYHALPADTVPFPAFSQPQGLPLVRRRPFTSPYSAGGFDMAPPSINNVRRPQNHLHFPQYSPYAFEIPEDEAYPYYGGIFLR